MTEFRERTEQQFHRDRLVRRIGDLSGQKREAELTLAGINRSLEIAQFELADLSRLYPEEPQPDFPSSLP